MIVAGAGPAGNVAALRLSEMGHRVAVVDWRESLGDKLCTGIVGRECVERYPPDKADIWREAQSATIVAHRRTGRRCPQSAGGRFLDRDYGG